MAKNTVLIVDDDPAILAAYKRFLRRARDEWDVDCESCPQAAWKRIQQESFDVVVSDVQMPGITGLQLLDMVKNNPATHEVAFIIVTGGDDEGLKRQALDLGAADLLSKPVHMDDLVARLRSVLRAKRYEDALKEHMKMLEQRVRERTAELNASRLDILWKLGKAAEYRDSDTGNHIIRVGAYSRVVAKALGFDDHFCDTLFLAAPLHDVGKIGVPDAILLKKGRLSEEEQAEMQRHCEKGHSILSDPCKVTAAAVRYCGVSSSEVSFSSAQNPLIELAASIALSHHEMWDGGGYPYGLAGQAIPIEGRIVAVADVYDALRSQRPYKSAFSVARSLEIIREKSGSHFEPAVVEAFLSRFSEIGELELELKDLVEVDESSELRLFLEDNLQGDDSFLHSTA